MALQAILTQNKLKIQKKNKDEPHSIVWLIFYGLKIGLSKQEIFSTRYGELCDLITCFGLSAGVLKRKGEKPGMGMKKMPFEEAMKYR